MNKRQARKIAHAIAYRVLEKSIAVGGGEAVEFLNDATAEAQIAIEKELDALTQRHFDCAHDLIRPAK